MFLHYHFDALSCSQTSHLYYTVPRFTLAVIFDYSRIFRKSRVFIPVNRKRHSYVSCRYAAPRPSDLYPSRRWLGGGGRDACGVRNAAGYISLLLPRPTSNLILPITSSDLYRCSRRPQRWNRLSKSHRVFIAAQRILNVGVCSTGRLSVGVFFATIVSVYRIMSPHFSDSLPL